MQEILLSLHAKYWDLIKSGKKTFEVRTKKPQNISFQYLLFDKRTGECLKIENDAIVNDMVGNLPFRPVARVADNVLMAWLEVPYLQEQMEKGIQLPDELKRMKDDDNAVLMLVYLKFFDENILEIHLFLFVFQICSLLCVSSSS